MSDKKPDTDFDDKTAIRQEPNDDETSIREDRGADDPPVSDDGDRAETIVRDKPTPADEENATILRESSSQDRRAGDADKRSSGSDSDGGSATILRSPEARESDGATILREPKEPSNDQATILRAGSQSDDGAATILRGGEEEDSATILRGDDDGATILRDGGGPPDDSTVMRDGAEPPDDDRTVMNPDLDDDATVIGDGAGGEADTTYVATARGPQRSRGNSEAGRLLKNRFVLEEKVGSGGMGDVYKALDLRQQEAQERNPYIAIKILNENFARHKDAFISLQREATRTRGIPHPNIMGVYDFDREGDTVFMSMELLDGKPLDDYLKEHPEGVSVEDAWNIIDGICQGLARAHGAGIVHSDFKPGNIYYCDDKTAKVFDFGIARAVSNPGDIKADGEKTVFDAGSLGALTPTYASLEMLTGKEPTKSDDVYAVALVAYELFTGRHPYNRTPADKALERGLEPEPVPFLKRRHWRALKKGLALKREDRWESIDEFYEGMFSEDPPYLRYAAIAAVLVASIGFGVYSFLYGGEERPPDLVELEARVSADKTNLRQKLLVSPVFPSVESLKPAKQLPFDSEQWRADLEASLARLRNIDLVLLEEWGEEWEYTEPDQEINTWKDVVLAAYLREIGRIREEVVNTNIEADDDPSLDKEAQLQENKDDLKDLIEELEVAEAYLETVHKKLNFDADAISDEESRLAQAVQFRDFQYQSIVEDIEEAEAERIAQEEAETRAEELRQFTVRRNNTYRVLLDDFRDILRCKGEIRTAPAEGQEIDDLTRLGIVLNGPGVVTIDGPLGEEEIVQHKGLRDTYPEQFEIDKPGIVQALRGCITQRIAVRDPDHAREVKRTVMGYLPGAPELAAIEIEDLDPCAARNLEGRGTRSGSWCSDRLAVGGTGPELVVVPKPVGEEQEKFAISRIEIRVGDYNQFCEETGCSSLSGSPSLPATNISLQQAQAYTAWLSDQTGKDYRLPTRQEWLWAARTDEDQPLDDNINCTVDARGVRLGDKLLSTLSGRPNKWGLYNYVGNAREWAVTDEGVLALGGAHTDPKAECTIEKSVPHSGQPDPVTGFRIVRRIEDPKEAKQIAATSNSD